MNLRWTIVGLILLTLLGLVAVVSITLQSNLGPLFYDQEQQLARATMSHIQEILDERYRLLKDISINAARNDATYTALRDGSSDIDASAFTPQRFSDLDIHLMAVVNLDGQIIHSFTYDQAQGNELPFPEELREHLQPGDTLLLSATDLESRSGLLSTEAGPLLFVAEPVLRSDGSGPAQGTLIAGRFLDASEIQRIIDRINLPVVVTDYASAVAMPEFNDVISSVSASKPIFLVPISDVEMNGYHLLSDYYGQPAYVVKVTLNRTVARNSQLVLNYLVITLVASVLLFGIITILSVDRLVLGPLANLGKQVSQIGRSGDLSVRIKVKRRDELGKLGNHINQMLDNLQQSRRRSQESEERFGRLVESMDDLVFTLDERMTQMNIYGDKARSLGIPETISLPGNLEAPLEPERALDDLGGELNLSAETLRSHLKSLQLALAGEHLAYEWTAQADGKEYNFQSVLSPMTDRDGRRAGVVGVARDISDLKELENALHKRVRDLNALNDVSREFLSQLDARSIYQQCCQLAVQHFGVDAAWIGVLAGGDLILHPQAADGMALDQLPPLVAQSKIAPDQHPAIAALLDQQPVMLSKTTLTGAKAWGMLAPAERLFLELLAIPITAGESRAALVIFSLRNSTFTQDMVQLFQALGNLMSIALNNAALFAQVRADQVRLQMLSQRLVDIQEEERREIALELHDEIGQLLTGLKIQLDSAGNLPAGESIHHIEAGRLLAEDLIQKVRNLSLDLRPSMLDDLGLLPALLWHFDRYTSLSGIRVEFMQSGLEGVRFTSNLETTAYRIIQEGLTNIARHAGVKEAAVRAIYAEERLTIQIEDRGAGFATNDALDSSRSRGLLGMRERVAFVGGTFTIDSVPGWGTLLVVDLPVPRLEDGGKLNDHGPASG